MPRQQHVVQGEIPMSQLLHGLAVVFMLLCSALTTQIATAEDSIKTDEITTHVVLTELADHDAQETREPPIDPHRLSDDIREKISALVRRKEELLDIREDNKMNVGDYIFAVIMPGGLLYAGYKQREYYLAKKGLAEVTAEINSYVNDLDTMQVIPGSVVLAPQHLVDVNVLGQRF